ncbi:uroporphyrinogen decarboxylase/cobalamine-independent methonine synthase family protein [Desulforhopalus singaporensis]|uniref:Methionine synthase II (Cobalamin-independent) n=1 Tax=Desulforhopalus singaporensis TaxID=91360 RepID=A0A1H0TYK2_9BACT|nr:hypothetical protein [Desulforhopalus singaporensis]SDP59127.1 hypothetical protein SAMN05660330_03305 [Desulforhopalus singaporensis]
MIQTNCHPILIGSLPHSTHAEAVRLVLRHCPQIPLWPQLPQQPREGMVRQFLTGFPGLTEEGKNYRIDTEGDDFAAEMASFYEDYFLCSENPSALNHSRFALDHDAAAGFFALLDALETREHSFITLKGQITGPVTAGTGLRDTRGNAVIYDDNLRDMMVKHLALKGVWQIKNLHRFTGSAKPIIFIDEPGIVSFGSTGFSGVTREMVTQSVTEVIEHLHWAGGLAGIHICANGDWTPALASPADIISFDAYFYFDNFILYKEPLTDFLKRGGILAWGIVPTSDPQVVERENSLSLFTRLRQQLATLSTFTIPERRLISQILIAPSCGTGSLSPELAEKVLTMTGEVSQMARSYYQSPK